MSTLDVARSEAAHAAGPIESGYRRMWQIGWPVCVSTSTVTLFMIANLFWVGHLGTEAVAAVSMCSHILFIVFGVSQVVFVGTLAIVSRRVGEGNTGAAYETAVHAAVLGAGLGASVGLLGWFAATPILKFFQVADVVEELAVSYLQLAFAGEVFLFVSMAIAAAYSGAGDTRTPMLLNGGIVALNAVIDPLFIFAPGEVAFAGLDVGWLGMGVYGAAVADVVSAMIGMLAFIAVSVMLGRPFPRPRGPRLALRVEMFRQIVRIGIPAGVSFIARPLSTFFLMRVIASFGTTALAAFGIALRTFSINWIPFSGLNTAVAALVGQTLGGRDVDRAERVVVRGVRAGIAFAVGFCVFYGTFAVDLIAFFDTDPGATSAPARSGQAVRVVQHLARFAELHGRASIGVIPRPLR